MLKKGGGFRRPATTLGLRKALHLHGVVRDGGLLTPGARVRPGARGSPRPPEIFLQVRRLALDKPMKPKLLETQTHETETSGIRHCGAI